MLWDWIIEESVSPWPSPIVAVPEPDGSLWICNNFRRLNQVAEFKRYPLPQVDDLMNCLGRVCFVSTLDLTRGYWQVALTPEARLKTAFSTPSGHRNPDFDQPFTEHTNASETGLVAVVSQTFEGEHPVLYISHKLTPTERRYAAMERKALAIKWAVTELRYYLTGRHLTRNGLCTPPMDNTSQRFQFPHNMVPLFARLFFPGPAPSRGPIQEYRWLVIKLPIYLIPRVQGSSMHSPLQTIPQVFDRI